MTIRVTHVILLVCLLVVVYQMGRDGFQSSCMPPDVKNYVYMRRVLTGNQWVCPREWQDTGCSWEHGTTQGQYQCRKLSPCVPGDPNANEYTRRTLQGARWLCPAGWQDTGCSWQHEGHGEHQCRRPKTATAATTATTTTIPTNISYYGQNASDDNGSGYVGVDLFSFGRFQVKYGDRRVYPVAVHQDHAAEWLFAVVEVTGPKIAPGFLGYVVDICNRNAPSCSNKDKNGRSFLIDIHKTGYAASGNTNNGKDFTTGNVRKVGHIPITSLPAGMFPKGDDTYVRCSGSGDKWKHLGKLKSGKETC